MGSLVKIAKVKGKTKQKVSVTKMSGKPRLIDLPFLDEKPAQGTRSSHKRKGSDDDSKKMVHYNTEGYENWGLQSEISQCKNTNRTQKETVQ